MTGGSGWTADPWLQAQAEAMRRWFEAPVSAMQELASLARQAAATGEASGALRDFGVRFFAATSTPFTSAAGAPAPGFVPGSTGGLPPTLGPTLGPALGPAREHLERAAELANALQALAAAQQVQATLVTTAGHAAAAAYAARLAQPDAAALRSPRAAFDAWIECAEAAWLDLAHGEAWCAAQARTFDAAIRVREVQQSIADHAARLAGLPTLADVDALNRRVRDLERAKERKARRPRRAQP
jgi:hypothetical protein